MGWANVEDVQQLTGKTVQDTDVQYAQAVIEVTNGGLVASLDSVMLSRRNLEWLRRATAYQTAFMVEYPDYFSRADVASFSQDSVSATTKKDSFIIAPLAKRCLNRLSWRGMRTVNPSASRRPLSLYDGGTQLYGSALADDELPYQPL